MPSVKVYVDDEGAITCKPDPLKIGETLGSVMIKWKMKTKGWEITEITDSKGDPLKKRVFKDSKKDDKTNWKIRDMNDDVLDYEYMVHIKSVKTGECKAHDPIIRNGGRM